MCLFIEIRNEHVKYFAWAFFMFKFCKNNLIAFEDEKTLKFFPQLLVLYSNWVTLEWKLLTSFPNQIASCPLGWHERKESRKKVFNKLNHIRHDKKSYYFPTLMSLPISVENYSLDKLFFAWSKNISSSSFAYKLSVREDYIKSTWRFLWFSSSITA